MELKLESLDSFLDSAPSKFESDKPQHRGMDFTPASDSPKPKKKGEKEEEEEDDDTKKVSGVCGCIVYRHVCCMFVSLLCVYMYVCVGVFGCIVCVHVCVLWVCVRMQFVWCNV